MEKRIITIPKLSPNLLTEPISTDPTKEMFTAFNVYDSETKELLGAFHADDIVQQRNFMVALTGKGPGLFTQHLDNTLDETLVQPDVPHNHVSSGCSELLMRQQSYDRMTNLSLKGHFEPPSYSAIMVDTPKEYYSPSPDGHCSTDEELRKFPGQLLPVYDASNLPTSDTTKAMRRREYEDTFLPPHGPPVNIPVSIGYGSEVGLKEHQQVMWDPSQDIYFFVDHSTKRSFLNDPRPLEPNKPTITKTEISCKNVQRSHQLPKAFMHSRFLNATSDTQSQKPIGLVLNAAGSHGSNGNKGQDGKRGQSGQPGGIGTFRNGKDGEGGLNGVNARSGLTGKPGHDGGNLTITLKGSVSELHIDINDSVHTIMNLGDDRYDEVVLVNCRGGNGGDGGEGGDGGSGGAGGDGGEGTHKGDGGHGGDGGMGGDGGAGGNGGSAGNGGHCVIQATVPSLLMLVEADCQAGVHGEGAQGGKGGEGGAGGFGGNGASWQEADVTSGQYTLKTVTGMRGKPGMTGSAGMSGTAGSDGSNGENGGVLWRITSENGEVLHQASKRYELEVTNYDVTPGSNNDIYEPNQRIRVTNVTVVNSGGLPLPAGAKVFFPSNETARFEPTVYVLPELTPTESFTVPVTFNGRIFDQATPNSSGPLNVQAHVSSRIDFLGRSFEKSVTTKTLPVSYPIKLSFALSRKTMSCGEISTLDIGIENISQLLYGSSCTDTGGSVYLKVHMDPRLLPLGIYSQVSHASLPYAINYDPTVPDSMFIHIHEIQPGETLIVPVLVLMESQAELCDTCMWQVDLYLKGKLIEYKSQIVRVSPAYTPLSDPAQTGDLLMIVNKHLKREQFVLLQRIFNILSVNVDYWDSSKRKRSSSTSPSPEVDSSESLQEESESKLKQLFHTYRGKTILYPHFHYQDVPAEDIVSYLKLGNESHSPCDQNSNLLLFHSSTFPKSLEDYHFQQSGDTQLLRYLCLPEEKIKIPQSAYSGHHILPPGTLVSMDCMIKRATKNVMRKIEHDEPSQTVVVMNHTRAIQHKRALHYSYGILDVRRCPLLRSCNFQFVDGAAGSMMSMGSDDPLLNPSSREFPLASKFGQVFLAVMHAIPLRCKLAILKKSEKKSSPNFVRFHLPNGLKFVKQELAAICIAREVADELLNCSGNITQMQYILNDLEANKTLCAEKDTAEIISAMLNLIATEVAERKKAMPFPIVAQTSNEILQLCCSSNFLKKLSCLKKLPQLKLLQDSSRVLRSHQLTVDDDHYNVSKDL